MFLIPYLLDNSADSSTLIFPTLAVSEKSSETSSIIGPINLQGPHHSAQNLKELVYQNLKLHRNFLV